MSGTYFFTQGWLRGERTLWHEFAHAVQTHGEARARRLFASMLHSYSRCALLDTGCFDQSAASEEVRRIAGTLGLEYCETDGTLVWLEELVSGPWPAERFITVPSYSTVERRLLTRTSD